MRDPVAALSELIAERLQRPPPVDGAFARALADRPTVAAVVLYGSCLTGTAAADSEPDFFVIVDALMRHHRRIASAIGNWWLPPSVYHRVVDGASCKASVLSIGQLAAETSPRARDLYHLGRFSKPLAIAWARDEAARGAVHDAQLASLLTLAPHARGLAGPHPTVDDFMLALFSLSYLAEVRVEQGRVRALYEADRAAHRAVGELLLAACPIAAPRAATGRLIARSRRRAIARWPKALFTFDGWLEYAVRKVERHTGRRLELTERQRRHPLLFGWPALASLRRDGLLR